MNPHDDNKNHGSTRDYNIGFVWCLLLTGLSFYLIMEPTLSRPTTLLAVVGLAVLQLVVQMVYFLHMNRSDDEGWNLLSFAFTVVILVIVVALSIWIIWSMHYHMMIN